MVGATVARRDCDNLFFNGNKTAIYYQVTETEDATYGSQSLSYTAHTIPINGNITDLNDRMVKQGLIAEGTAVGVLRHEYTEDADGNSISPTLYPKEDDEFVFLGRRFRITKLTPKMSEDHKVILYTFEAKPVDTQSERQFPLTFPIQF